MHWYESKESNKGAVVSSRVRLARNVKEFPFPRKVGNQQASDLVEHVLKAVEDGRERIGSLMFLEMSELPDVVKISMLERHTLSQQMIQSQLRCGVLVSADDSLAILVNEEDHIRIQSFRAGSDIDAAFAVADSVDDTLEDTLDYAYSDRHGYLTSCPTNTGTGLRASYMVHLPMLERYNQLRRIVPLLMHFGMTIRGMFGEGSESLGSFYQISNQKTLGEPEEEIIRNLKRITRSIIEREDEIIKKLAGSTTERYGLLDEVHRAYGVLTNCRQISSKEAMSLLSSVRMGYSAGLLDAPEPSSSLLSIMMNIREANIKLYAEANDDESRKIARSEYLRSVFK